MFNVLRRRAAAAARLDSVMSARVSRSAQIESLERRCLMAANPAVVALVDLGGILHITGTKKADVISVAPASGAAGQLAVNVGGTLLQSFSTASLSSISILGGGGNDTITVDPAVTLAVTILGEKGNDDIAGGSGDDRLDGGVGNDTIAGSAGNDNCIGGAGNDSVSGDLGVDFCSGDAGRDRLRGGGDDDDLDGGSGNDDVGGDDGLDRVRGGSGKDLCGGGSGNDDVAGGSGKDLLTGDDGLDTFDDSDAREFVDLGTGDTAVTEDDSTHVTIAEVPAAVLTSFNTLFPGATVREVERETEDAGVEYKLDYIDATGLRRRATFNEAGQLLEDRGHAGGGNSGGNGGGGGGGGIDDGIDDGTQINFAELPAAVSQAFGQLFGGATVNEVEREQEDEGLVFKIDFNDAAQIRKRAEFSEGGQLLDLENR